MDCLVAGGTSKKGWSLVAGGRSVRHECSCLGAEGMCDKGQSCLGAKAEREGGVN